MVEIRICVGGSCHLRGARDVIGELNRLIISNDVVDNIQMEARSCMDNCLSGSCMEINGKKYTNVSVAFVQELFEDKIMPMCYSQPI